MKKWFARKPVGRSTYKVVGTLRGAATIQVSAETEAASEADAANKVKYRHTPKGGTMFWDGGRPFVVRLKEGVRT